MGTPKFFKKLFNKLICSVCGQHKIYLNIKLLTAFKNKLNNTKSFIFVGNPNKILSKYL